MEDASPLMAHLVVWIVHCNRAPNPRDAILTFKWRKGQGCQLSVTSYGEERTPVLTADKCDFLMCTKVLYGPGLALHSTSVSNTFPW